MDHIEQAKRNIEEGYSCSQAVLMAFAEELGLSTETAARVAAGFGGGMGRSGRTCGAVSGALMVVGLVEGGTSAADKAAKERTYAMARQVMEEFEARRGALDCRELLGVDISTAEGLAQAREHKLFAGCTRHVEEAARIASDLIRGNSDKSDQ